MYVVSVLVYMYIIMYMCAYFWTSDWFFEPSGTIPVTRVSDLITITITRDYLQKLTKVQAAISVHSFGNVLIYPWGYKVISEVVGDDSLRMDTSVILGLKPGKATRASGSPCFPCQRHQPSDLQSYRSRIVFGLSFVVRESVFWLIPVVFIIFIIWNILAQESDMKLGLVSSCFWHLKHSLTGERYEPGTAREVFGLWGLAGGATDDWYITQVSITFFVNHIITHCAEASILSCNSLSRQGLPYSYTFELPEFDASGKPHGFLLPASSIVRVFSPQLIFTLQYKISIFWLQVLLQTIAARLGDSWWLDLARWQAN